MNERSLNEQHRKHNLGAVFWIFLRLGLTSFGGPVAHLAYFRDEFVTRRRWLNEHSYADLVALCQFLPGPASSQVGMALGLTRAGYGGALAAWLGFTLPSAVAMIVFAMGLTRYGDTLHPGVLHGLQVVAVAVIVQAVWGMARVLCPDAQRATLMALSTCIVLLLPSVWTPVALIVIAGGVGKMLFKPALNTASEPLAVPVSRRAGIVWLMLFASGLIVLPLLAETIPWQALQIVDAFYRSGSLVFGGGHVVLPLLQSEVVPTGWVSNERFLIGYGAAQAVPGPLFTFSAFLGASITGELGGWRGGMLCLVAIFLPSFLLVVGALPFWEYLRRQPGVQAALAGVNAAVVGLLLAALYQPAWVSTIRQPQDFALALVALIALLFWKLPPWLVVVCSGLAGWLIHLS